MVSMEAVSVVILTHRSSTVKLSTLKGFQNGFLKTNGVKPLYIPMRGLHHPDSALWLSEELLLLSRQRLDSA